MTNYNDYQNILFNYNFTGNVAGTNAIPNIALSTDADGNYIISYTVFEDAQDVNDANYYSAYNSIINNIATTSYKQNVTDAFVAVMQSNLGAYSVLFEDVAKISFEASTTGTGEITFGQLKDNYFPNNSTTALSVVYNANDVNASQIFGDIWINTEHDEIPNDPTNNNNIWEANAQIVPGTHAFKILLEEISHSLGVDVVENAPNSYLDNQQYTVTSYNLLSGMDTAGFSDDVAPAGLQLYDIAALQEIYGREYATRSGNTNYNISTAFTSTALNDAFIYTIWDGNGHDTISAAGFYESGLGAGASSGAVIDLRQGEFSSIGSSVTAARATDNVAIAFHTIIEDAIGSVKGDIIIGNAWDNKLEGGAGNDDIYGDGVIYDGNVGYGATSNERDINSPSAAADLNGSGDDELIGGLGNDTLYGGLGEDTYVYNLGDGNDLIIDPDEMNLVFGAGIDFSNLSISQNGNDFIWNFSDGGSATIQNYYLNVTGSTDTITYGGNQANWSHANANGQSLTGTDNNDVLSGSSGNDTINGGEGNDLLFGGSGNDNINAEGASDYSTDADDKVYGGSGNDNITSFFGNDYIDSGSGDDYVRAYSNDRLNLDIYTKSGNDEVRVDGYGLQQVINTGADNDIVNYMAYSSNDSFWQNNNYSANIDLGDGDDYLHIHYGGEFNVSLGDGNDIFINSLASHNLSQIAIVNDTFGNDDYRLTPKDTHITDYQGNDRYFIIRGNGNTFIDDRQGNDHIDSSWKLFDDGSGSGALQKIRAADQIGNDLVLDMYTKSLINGSNFGAHFVTIKDYYDGQKIENIKFSDVGFVNLDAYINASLNSSTISGTTGNDTNLNGNSNDDLIHALDGDDNVNGLSGNDTIFGGDGNDTIFGGDGTDILIGGLGDDILTGGLGSDSFTFNNLNEITSNTDHITDLEGIDNIDLSTISGLNFIGSAAFSNTINEMHYVFDNGTTAIEIDSTGNGIKDHRIVIDNGEFHLIEDPSNIGVYIITDNIIISGTSGNDVLTGTAEDETIVGYAGNDTINGGSGRDKVDYSADISGVVVNLHNGTATDGWGNSDTLTAIEDVVGSNFNDILVGNNGGENTLEGLDGDDQIQGRGNHDVLYGGNGNDDLNGHNGDDTLYGGDGSDILQGSVGNDMLFGEGGDDLVMQGGDGDDIIDGGDGNDQLRGQNDNDTLIGGLGIDRLDGEAGIDTADFSAGTEGVITNLATTNTANDGHGFAERVLRVENIIGSDHSDTLLGSNDDNEVIGGLGGDTIKTYGGNDIIYGNAGNDYLYGGTGNDIIYDGDGLDVLYGQGGADTFVFEAISAFNNIDNVKDFSLSDGDKLNVSDLLALYDPFADLITDFVQITDNGTHSYLKIDSDGGADNFQQIAQISFETGLTDEAVLENNGTLII